MSTVKRKCKVAMLPPTNLNQKPTLLYNPSTKTLETPKHEHDYPATEYIKAGYEVYELYFYNDDKIKVTDWTLDEKITYKHGCITSIDNQIELERYAENSKFNVKKIIASTDNLIIVEELAPPCEENDYFGEYLTIHTPKPTKSFVEKFIKQFNKRDKITEVMVDFYDICETYAKLNGQKLKLSDKDNTITIHKVKESWDKGEVEALITKAILDYSTGYSKPASEWIKKHL